MGSLAHQPPWAIPIYVIVFWYVVRYSLAFAGGWRDLSRFYTTASEATGKILTMRYGGFKLGAQYNGVLQLSADMEGLFLSLMPLFRIGHPPLFIPWTKIRVRRRRSWFRDYVDITTEAVPSLPFSISPSTYRELTQASGGNAPALGGTW